ncbi:hypothetical protein GCM10022409_13410 [Hymenobacter glaciei]|uniref:SMODS-associated and fused to various effectors domain-containing protein n=1 Tax=Hymenobacter glaciei TaxID=877209 RepID=A0ABP7TST8_9BACT
MKAKVFTPINILIFLITIIILLATELFKAKNPSSDAIPYINIASNLAIAALTGLLVGIYFDLFSRKEVYENMLRNFEISKEVITSGLVSYYPSFMDFDFRKYLLGATRIDMYLTYGQTLFSTYNDAIAKIAGQKGKQINIFIYHEDNIFVDALEKHWNQAGSSTSTRNKIIETKTTLISQFNELKRKKQIKAKIRIHFIKVHPNFYSFYRFDDHLILCPSKISRDKAVRPFAFLFKRTDEDGCVYTKCMSELNNITSDPTYYEVLDY